MEKELLEPQAEISSIYFPSAHGCIAGVPEAADMTVTAVTP